MKINQKYKVFFIVCLVLSLFVPLSAQAADQGVDLNLAATRVDEDKISIGNNISSVDRVQGSVVSIMGGADVENGANGDVVVILGSSRVKGNVTGDVVAVGGNTDINGQVMGDVVAVGGKVILRGQSVVTGDVVGSKIEKSPDAVIMGDVIQLPIPRFAVSHGFEGSEFFQAVSTFGKFHALFKLAGLLVTLVLVLLVVAAYPQGVETIGRWSEKDTLRSFAVGFFASLLFIPISLTIIGIPVAIALYLAAKFLGYAGVALFIGRKFAQGINWETQSMYHLVLTGVVLVGLVKLVPFLGGLLGLVMFWISLGAMLDSRFGTGRPWFNKA